MPKIHFDSSFTSFTLTNGEAFGNGEAALPTHTVSLSHNLD